MFQHVRVALPVLLFAAGCTGNSSSSSTPSTPVTPTPTVSSVTVSGSSPALGETTQFTATATLSNAATHDVTAQATWQTSDGGVATVSSGGLVRSVAAGEADITATYSGVTGSQHVRVAAVPAALRTLTGVIADDSTGRPIVDQAEAQIMDGENAGKAGRVDGNGVYSIPDVAPGAFMLRARATGFESRDQPVTMSDSDVRVDFTLRAVPCSYVVTAQFDRAWPDSYRQVPSTGGQFTADVRRTSGTCSWDAKVIAVGNCDTCFLDREQVELTGPASGSDSAVVTYKVPAAVYPPFTSWPPDIPTPPRRREIDVTWRGGISRIEFEQRLCVYRPPALVSVDAPGGSSSHQVVWDRYCQFAVSADANWIGISKGDSGFSLNVPANTLTTSRTGTITITGPFGVSVQTTVVQTAVSK
jgi:hypothetical protein